MFEIHPSSWPLAVDASEGRDQFHLTALHEARVATERNPRLAEAAVARRAGFTQRLRAAFTGAPARSAEPCTCPA